MKIRVINGPNINRLGKREPEIYGTKSYEDLVSLLMNTGQALGAQVEVLQSNYEGQICSWIHEDHAFDALIINPGAYSHTSIAILDALYTLMKPIIEVHISNVHKREDFRQHLMTAKAASGIIAGFGLDSYVLALQQIMRQ
jgi:3-dehydroquinate dehydratase-2